MPAPNTLILYVILVAALASGCRRSPDLEISRRFQQAERDFAKATTADEFLNVASQYEEILGNGFVSGTVLFNQGNAFMQAGDRGRAIAAYRQAKRFRPRDPYLDANLRNALRADATESERSSVAHYILFWQDWLSYHEKFALTTAVLGVTLLLALASRLLAKGRLWKRLVLAPGLLTIVMGLSTAYDWYRFDAVKHGVVIDNGTVARKGNSVSYEPAFTAALGVGDEFELLERRENWLLIRVSEAGEGWIPDSSATIY